MTVSISCSRSGAAGRCRVLYTLERMHDGMFYAVEPCVSGRQLMMLRIVHA
jgi:hypothetical protein